MNQIVKSIIIALFLFSNLSFAQSSKVVAYDPPTEWPDFPGLEHGGPITLTNQKIFIRVAGAAAASYILAKFVFNTKERGDFLQLRSSLSVGEYKTVIKENIGMERRLASWFAVALEFSFQQWHDSTPYIEEKEKYGVGIGLQPYFRWYLLGEQVVSPFLEFGTGFFQGFEKFPYNGTKYTFTHSSHFGLEINILENSKLRVSYGQFHQSNNDWWDVNPSYNGNGFNLSYAWKM